MNRLMIIIGKYKIVALVVVAAILIGVAYWFTRGVEQSTLTVETDKTIDITPEQIQSIKAIGEWEFLSVSDEEMVDTIRKGIFSDDHLVRIYYGTLRIGINMHQVSPGWLKASGDSVTVILPNVGLLDKDFIDEARTKSFYESGRWSAADREALYKRAYQKMLKACLTESNLQSAENNADTQMRSMMKSMGFKTVIVRFEK